MQVGVSLPTLLPRSPGSTNADEYAETEYAALPVMCCVLLITVVLHCLSQQSAGLASTKLALFAVVDLALGAI